MKYNKLNPLALIASLVLLLSSYSMAEPASVIEAKANEALKQFAKEVKGSEEFLSKTKGYLVFPSVVKAGFVVGGEYGDGSIAVAKWGKGKDIGSISFEKPIYAFVFGAKGLMYNLNLKGTKFTKINR
jgi:lipid-binding SYLF domain-containing protein